MVVAVWPVRGVLLGFVLPRSAVRSPRHDTDFGGLGCGFASLALAVPGDALAGGVSFLAPSGADPGVASSMFCLLVSSLFSLTILAVVSAAALLAFNLASSLTLLWSRSLILSHSKAFFFDRGSSWDGSLSVPPPTSPPGADPEAATSEEGAGGGGVDYFSFWRFCTAHRLFLGTFGPRGRYLVILIFLLGAVSLTD